MQNATALADLDRRGRTIRKGDRLSLMCTSLDHEGDTRHHFYVVRDGVEVGTVGAPRNWAVTNVEYDRPPRRTTP